MKRALLSTSGKRGGFTLVELLVSMTILAIMLLGLGQAMAFVSQVWVNGIGTMDNFTKARVILNLLDRDIQMMVMRPDVPAFVDDNGNLIDPVTNNSICAFYTNVQGSPGADNRTVSLVQYLLNPTLKPAPATAPSAEVLATTLGRLNYGLNFPGGAGTPLTLTLYNSQKTPPDVAKLSDLTNANVQTESLYTGIIRFQIQFVDGTGTVQPTFSYDYNHPGLSTNSHAVVVSLLVLSNSAYTAATQNATVMTKLKSDFQIFTIATQPSPPSPLPPDFQTYSQYWRSTLTPPTGTFDPTLPASVREGLQVFDRYIPLPLATSTSS